MKRKMNSYQSFNSLSNLRKGLYCFFMFLFSVSFCYASPQNRKDVLETKKVNCGIRAGFNSSMFFVSSFTINGIKVKDFQNSYKLGYFGTFFMQFNMKRHFIQPELSYNINKAKVSFDKLGTLHPTVEPDYTSLESTIHSIDLPILYGYNIIKRAPYSLSVMAGPKVRYILQKQSKIEFDNFQQDGIQEELYPFVFNFVAGISVSISKVYFDFRYEQGLHNISKSISYPAGNSNKPTAIRQFTLNRREQVLSFSLGIIF